MGLMDKFKDQMAQGEALAKQAGVDPGAAAAAGMPTQAQADYAQLATKVAASGVPCKATITSITPTGVADVVTRSMRSRSRSRATATPTTRRSTST